MSETIESQSLLALHQSHDEAPLSIRDLGKLILRTWPYLRPQLRHLIIWSSARMLIEVVWLMAALVAFDLFNNKVLVGEKLESSQVTLLFLDDSYLAQSAPGTEANPDLDLRNPAIADEDAAEGSDENVVAVTSAEQMTPDQRVVVRDRLLILFAVAAVFLFMISPLVDYYRTWILQRVNQYLRVTMIERAEHLSLRYHSHARTGDAIYRVYQDSAMITSVIERILLEPMVAVGQVIFSFIIICLFSPVLGVMFLAGIVPILWLTAWYTPRLQIRSRRARTSNSDLTSRIQESFAAIRIIKANRAEEVLASRFDTDSNRALDAAFFLRAEYIIMRMFLLLIAGLMNLATQYLAAGWTISSDPTFLAGAVALVGFVAWNFGAFQAVQSRTEEFVGNGMDLIRIWSVVQDMSVGLDRAFFLLDLKPDVVDSDDAVPMPAPIREVRYDHVSFGYDPEFPVLRDITLTAGAGTITAIVGGTGCGKSTMMTLLLRLYNTDTGTVSINGTDISEIQIETLRASVAIALQQNTLFATSIADNIAYACADVDRMAVEAAARVACADEFILAMSDGYDTELGERGSKLSAGQRQRLSIARAIVRDTPVLILDEPTASLDAETEHQVLENLAEWGKDRVVFLITHRLSTIRNADQIAFLEDGSIRELGDHQTLMAIPDGRYRHFVESESVGEAVQS